MDNLHTRYRISRNMLAAETELLNMYTIVVVINDSLIIVISFILPIGQSKL